MSIVGTAGGGGDYVSFHMFILADCIYIYNVI